MSVGVSFARLGIQKGICKEFVQKMRNTNNVEVLVSFFFEGADIAIEKDFPTVAMLHKYGKGKENKYGLFADKNVTLKNLLKCAFFGKSRVFLTYDQYKVGQVYREKI